MTPDVAHEFAARWQFGTTFVVMEFLARKQIKLSQHMAEEHAEMQMIQHEDERALNKIGRMRNAGEGRFGIELPLLNANLVEVHWELVAV